MLYCGEFLAEVFDSDRNVILNQQTVNMDMMKNNIHNPKAK